MTMTIRMIRGALLNDRTLFVLVNVIVNMIFLVRSYITMRVLGYSDLGLVALLQTIILLVGALQFGIVNGGYRLLCSEPGDGARHINNFFYSFMAVLAVLCLGVGVFTAAMSREAEYALVVGGAMVAGILTVVKTWLTNYLIAKIMLRRLNRITLISAALSMAPLSIVGSSPLLACAGSIILQPLVFVVYLLIVEKDLRPTEVALSVPLLRRVLSAGFLVYLTGVFIVANSQIERWSIVTYLGLAGLGRFYLALLFLNIYTLIPSSLDAIFLPKIIQDYVKQDFRGLQADLRRFFYLALGYAIAVTVGVALLSHLIIGLLLPRYLDDLHFVYLVLPGAVLFGLTSPFALVFNVLIRYRFYFYAYCAGTLSTIILLYAYIRSHGSIDLNAVSIIKSTVSTLMGLLIMVGYLKYSSENKAFRFYPWRLDSRRTA